MFTKIQWDDASLIDDDDLFDKIQDDENHLKQVILCEIENLKKQGIEIIKHMDDEDSVIVKTPNFNYTFDVFSSKSIYQCNEFGKIIDETKNKLDLNTKKIQSAKAEIIIDYFRTNGFKIGRVMIDKNIITYSCPLCGKTNDKLRIIIGNFETRTFSETDCVDKWHKAKYKEIQKHLKKIWDDSDAKESLVFSLNVDYLNNTISKNFPLIIRHEPSHLLFMYDKVKKYYVEIVDNKIHSDLDNLIYGCFFKEGDCILTVSELSNVKNYIKHHYAFPRKEFEKCNLINCSNGVVNILTGELKPHSTNYFFTYINTYAYNPHADPTKCNDFINAVITEAEPVTLVQRILGHIHYQGKKLEKGLIFKGTKAGRNGKGTMVKLLRYTIGENRTVTHSLNRFNETSFSGYELKDRVLYIDDDYKADYISAKTVGFLNSLITGVEDVVHQKNMPAIRIKHSAIPLLQCNKMPKLKAEDDGGFYLRWVVVNFGNEFGNVDKMDEFLSDKLLEDEDVMSTMLNHLIEGYKQLIHRKENDIRGNFFKEDDGECMNTWKKENNSVLQFVDEVCELNNNYSVSSRELYKYYRDEWNLNGSKLSEAKFVTMLKDELNLTSKRKKVNGKLITTLYGIKSVDDETPNILELEIIKSEL